MFSLAVLPPAKTKTEKMLKKRKSKLTDLFPEREAIRIIPIKNQTLNKQPETAKKDQQKKYRYE